MAFATLTAGLKFDKKHNSKAINLWNTETQAAPREETTFFTSAESGPARKKRKVETSQSDVEEENATLRKLYKIKCTGEDVPPPLSGFKDLPGFENIPKSLKDNLMSSNYAQPTPVQMQAIPILMQQRDLLACAPTGSGKTLAFLLPLILRYLEAGSKGSSKLEAIIIEPTRELSRQVYAHASNLAQNTGWKVHLLGEDGDEVAAQGANVLITTPMRLVHALEKKQISAEDVKFLVLDEADKLFELDFLSQTDDILTACSNPSLCHAMFSATFSSGIESFAMKVMKSSNIRVIVGQKDSATSLIKQELTFCGTEEGKLSTLRSMIATGGIQPPALIFTQSVDRAADLSRQLQSEKIKVDVIHADRQKNTRDRIIQEFAEGEIWLLICTDVMARGIDFKGVNLVINYDFPQSASAYIHRIGRTGRNGKPGRAVTFFSQDDAQHLKSIVNIMRNSGVEVPQWMLELKNPSRGAKKKMKTKPVERQAISASSGYPLQSTHAKGKSKGKKSSKIGKKQPAKGSKSQRQAISLNEASDA